MPIFILQSEAWFGGWCFKNQNGSMQPLICWTTICLPKVSFCVGYPISRSWWNTRAKQGTPRFVSPDATKWYARLSSHDARESPSVWRKRSWSLLSSFFWCLFLFWEPGGGGWERGGAHHGRVLVIAKKYLAMGEKKKRHKKTFALQASAKGVEKQTFSPRRKVASVK